jgi:tetratricopeptide (TPR) repeat protein
LTVLRAAEDSGRLGEREQGIQLGLLELQTNPADPELSLHVGRALGEHYRTTYQTTDLSLANGVLSPAFTVATGSQLVQLGTELARNLLQIALQARVRTDEVHRPAADQRAHALQTQAAALADGMMNDASKGSADYHAAGATLGAAYLDLGSVAKALPLLEEAVAHSIGGGPARINLATALVEISPANNDRVTAILTDTAEQYLTTQPREAFEAARYHGFWAAQRGAWDEAGEAYTRALTSRAALRREQGQYVQAREWLSEAGAIPSQAACALVRAGRAQDAVAALDAGLALNLSDRLGILHDQPAQEADCQPPPAGESWLFLAFDTYGGAAMVARSSGEVVAIVLPDANYGAVYERLLTTATTRGNWIRSGYSPQARRDAAVAIENALEWIGRTVLEPAISLMGDEANETDDIVLITDGRLDLLPLAAAPVFGRRLLERRLVRTTPNTRLLRDARRRLPTEPGSVLVIGVSDLAGEKPLQFASLEARAVAAIRSADTTLLGPAATADAAVAELPTHATAHFACHAASHPDPAQTVFGLTGPPLSLARLFPLQLEQLRLVVASACDTAMPDVSNPGEMHSLAGGLLHAGGMGVAATLWVADDRSSLLLSLHLHRALRDDSALPPAEALRRAQLWLRTATANDITQWLGEVAATLPDHQLGTELTTVMRGALPGSTPFAQVLDWACFSYFGA